MCRLIIIYFFVSLQLCLAQEKSKQWAQKADKLYRDSNYTEAEEFYRKANAENPDFNSQYNLANALYKQGRYNEAKLAYEIAASQKDAVDHKKAMAHFNLGNTQVNAKKYESAIDHYKESLKLQPSDPATKLNLAKAIQLKKIEKQQQQKQEDQNKDKNDPQKDQQQKDKNNPQ
ncbi:MAG: tetratricopeptide repeat protein, partial [Saprospiraceae bacterium]